MLKSGIYKITCLGNNRIYIGSAKCIDQRIKRHLWLLRKDSHENRIIQRSFLKYGEDSFKFETLEYCSLETLLQREQYYLDTLLFAQDYINKINKNFTIFGFNICSVAGSSIGVYHSEETKQILRDKAIKINKEKGNAFKGRKHSAESLLKMSKYQRNQSKESRLKRSLAQKGKKIPEERARRSNLSRTGQKRSDEAKERISKALKGRAFAKSHCEAISSSKKGKLIPIAMRPVKQLDLKGNLVAEFESVKAVGAKFGYSMGNISSCCTGKLKTAYGYKWAH